MKTKLFISLTLAFFAANLTYANPQRYGEIVSAIRDWPETGLIAWMENSAACGTTERPLYRYYLTKSRSLFAVRDSGDGQRRLFPLLIDDRYHTRVSPEANPFSGIH